MAGTFTLRVVSPEGNVLKEEAEFVVIPGGNGEIGILPNHAPLISSIGIGVIRYTVNGKVQKIATSGGFAEVSDNKVTVLADTAEPGERVDLDRALAAKERAEKRLAQREGIDVRRAELAFLRAVARISAARS
ncbi:F0F1 ATP synthase subunit epsilon [Desulfitobacterium hafniense]|uniref:F0F1 ATP synthase subunit epsilon n=1 Tax=Desulfitobacterium hafniense TaxID=49338 RepID=UPI000372926D|nr:F0F1 ATP synthase subunit epsilon [Desulfitobacterium hafniense]